MLKILSVFLSFAILFSSVAPSYAQALDSSRSSRRDPFQSIEVPQDNTYVHINPATRRQVDATLDSLDKTLHQKIQELPGQKLAYLKDLMEKMKEAQLWSEIPEEVREEIDLEDFNYAYDEYVRKEMGEESWKAMTGNAEAYQYYQVQRSKNYKTYQIEADKSAQEEFNNIKNLIKEVWELRSSFSEADRNWLAYEAMPFFKGVALLDDETTGNVAEYLRAQIRAAKEDCTNVGFWTGLGATYGFDGDLKRQFNRCEKAALAIMPLGIMGKAAKGNDRGDAALIGNLMLKSYNSVGGMAVAQSGMVSLIALDGWKELKDFLLMVPKDPMAKESYGKQFLVESLRGLSPFSLWQDLKAEDGMYNSFSQNIAGSFYKDQDGNPGNIFYDMAQYLVQEAKNGNKDAETVLETVMGVNLTYYWDKWGKNFPLMPNLRFKMFVVGALTAGYRPNSDVRKMKSWKDPNSYTNGYVVFSQGHKVSYEKAFNLRIGHISADERYFYPGEKGWWCGRFKEHWADTDGYIYAFPEAGFLAYGLLKQLKTDNTLDPATHLWVETGLKKVYNHAAKNCNETIRTWWAYRDDERYVPVPFVNDKDHTVYDAQGKAIGPKYIGQYKIRKDLTQTEKDYYYTHAATRQDGADKRVGAAWTDLISMILLTGGFSAITNAVKTVGRGFISSMTNFLKSARLGKAAVSKTAVRQISTRIARMHPNVANPAAFSRNFSGLKIDVKALTAMTKNVSQNVAKAAGSVADDVARVAVQGADEAATLSADDFLLVMDNGTEAYVHKSMQTAAVGEASMDVVLTEQKAFASIADINAKIAKGFSLADKKAFREILRGELAKLYNANRAAGKAGLSAAQRESAYFKAYSTVYHAQQDALRSITLDALAAEMLSGAKGATGRVITHIPWRVRIAVDIKMAWESFKSSLPWMIGKESGTALLSATAMLNPAFGLATTEAGALSYGLKAPIAIVQTIEKLPQPAVLTTNAMMRAEQAGARIATVNYMARGLRAGHIGTPVYQVVASTLGRSLLPAGVAGFNGYFTTQDLQNALKDSPSALANYFGSIENVVAMQRMVPEDVGQQFATSQYLYGQASKFNALQLKQQNSFLAASAVKLQAMQAGYPQTGIINSWLQSAWDNFYFTTIAPVQYFSNPYYQLHKQQPAAAAEAVAEENAAAVAETVETPVVAPADGPKTQLAPIPVNSNAGYLYSGIPVFSLTSRFVSYVSVLRANSRASYILSKTAPRNPDLRDILYSNADIKYKKDALVHLYKDGVFGKDVAAMASDARQLLSSAEAEGDVSGNYQKLQELLFSHYITSMLSSSLKGIKNEPTKDYRAELDNITKGDEWEAQRRAAYESTGRLNPDEDIFSGVVESLPNVNKELVLDAIRPAGFAASDSFPGVEEKGGLVNYKNNIPVYFRNAKGEVSAQPIAILVQPPSSLYTKILVRLKLSSPLGLKIPSGMALAIDEAGKWKIVNLPGQYKKRANSPAAKKIMKLIHSSGSYRVGIDVPYSSTDMLAIAKLAAADPNVNFQLYLNPSSSLNLYVGSMAFGVGLNADGVLVGPLKNQAKASAPEFSNTVPSAMGSVGFWTPLIAGWALPYMKKWGMERSIAVVLGVVTLALTYSVVGLGLYGVKADRSMADFILPMVALVLGASLLRTSMSIILNYHKDPQLRTKAFLDVSTYQQISRVALSLVTFLWTLNAPNHDAFIAIPIALALFAVTLGLYINTPMFDKLLGKKSYAEKLKDEAKAKAEAAAAATKTPEQLAAEKAQKEAEEKLRETQKATNFKEDEKLYNEKFVTTSEVKGIKSRVIMVYATYAATIMLLNQLVNGMAPETAAISANWGQLAVAVLYTASLIVRKKASKWVEKGRFTDDQLSGISILTMAASAGILAFLPFTGGIWLAPLAITAILHSMSTAVPGQLDSARMQNMVTAEMQKEKNEVYNNPSLSEAEREAKLKRIEEKESNWASLAGKSYSYYNAGGLIGMIVAIGLGFLLDTGIIGSIFGMSNSEFLTRAVFLYGAVMAGVATKKNWHMVTSFQDAFRKTNITQEAINKGEVSAKVFSINEKNAGKVLMDLQKGKRGMNQLKEQLGPVSVEAMPSEVKLTSVLVRMIQIHNRLVAIKEVTGMDNNLKNAFNQFYQLVQQYQKAMARPDGLSVSLTREFESLIAVLCKDGKIENGLTENPAYMPEGSYALPQGYDKFLTAQDLIKEVEFHANKIVSSDPDVLPHDTYQLLVAAYTKAHINLREYTSLNSSETKPVMVWQKRLADACIALKGQIEEKGLFDVHKNVIPQKDIQALKDLLEEYNLPVEIIE